MQKNLSPSSKIHVPPFLQGFTSHLFMSTTEKGKRTLIFISYTIQNLSFTIQNFGEQQSCLMLVPVEQHGMIC